MIWQTVISVTRRRDTAIQRAIIRTLGEKGPMTAGALANKIKATHRTISRHLYILERFRRKVEVVSYYPNIRLYRLRKARQVIRCQKCGARVAVAG